MIVHVHCRFCSTVMNYLEHRGSLLFVCPWRIVIFSIGYVKGPNVHREGDKIARWTGGLSCSVLWRVPRN
jgi:hypothetical protein